MAHDRRMAAATAIALAVLASAGPADAQVRCIFDWAVPGDYLISGNIQGRNERAVARLSRSCRVYFQIPGVYSGGPVQRFGDCLVFGFRVQQAPQQTFTAQWCNDRAVVPWQGTDYTARVTPLGRR